MAEATSKAAMRQASKPMMSRRASPAASRPARTAVAISGTLSPSPLDSSDPTPAMEPWSHRIRA